MAKSDDIRRYWILFVTVIVSAVLHGIGVLTMLLFIQPGLDFAATAQQRVEYVATHPWMFRLAWIPWQLTAASDLAVSATLVWYLLAIRNRTTSLNLALAAAILSVPLTITAMIPEQIAEAYLVSGYPALAQQAVADGPGSAAMQQFAAEERAALVMTGLCGNTGYTCMAIMWLAATFLAAPASWQRWLFAMVGLVSCVGFAGASVVLWRSVNAMGADGVYPAAELLVLCNGVGFGLLIPWMVWMAALLGDGHHHRYPAADARLHTLRWPRKTVISLAPVPTAGARDVARLNNLLIPVPILASDITGVVYLNWLVPVERVAPLLPPPLKPHRFGDLTFITVLTYQHHYFGPLLAGPLRRLCPSPTQSNWRFYLHPESDVAPRDGIYFFATCLGHPLLTIASRLMADGLPAHYPASLKHEVDGNIYETNIDPGGGSAPDLYAKVEALPAETHHRKLPPGLAGHFSSWEEAARYLVEQNRAVGVIPGHGRVYQSNIKIPIDVATILPAQVIGSIKSELLEPLIEGCEPFAFVVPNVPFQATGENWTARLDEDQ